MASMTHRTVARGLNARSVSWLAMRGEDRGPAGAKASVERDDLVAEHLPRLFKHLLRPMGLTAAPGDIDAAIAAFLGRRDQLEREYGLTVSRALEDEVRGGVRRLGMPAIGADESGVRAAVSARPLTLAVAAVCARPSGAPAVRPCRSKRRLGGNASSRGRAAVG